MKQYEYLLGQWIESGAVSGVCVSIFKARNGQDMILVEDDKGNYSHALLGNFKISEVVKN